MAHRWFQAWVSAPAFVKFWALSLEEYDALKGLDWSWQSMDGAMTKAPLGGGADAQLDEPLPSDPDSMGEEGRELPGFAAPGLWLDYLPRIEVEILRVKIGIEIGSGIGIEIEIGSGIRWRLDTRNSTLECAAIQDVLVVGKALELAESRERKVELDRIVAMLSRLGGRWLSRQRRTGSVRTLDERSR